jgi:hypothetical protein
MSRSLCWHRMVIRKGRMVCKHCFVEVSECPCVSFRQPDGKCPICIGSGWVANLRGQVAKFLEYLETVS